MLQQTRNTLFDHLFSTGFVYAMECSAIGFTIEIKDVKMPFRRTFLHVRFTFMSYRSFAWL